MKRYKLEDPRTFHYLNQSNCYEVANVDDAREYLETRNAMDIVGISQEEQVIRFWKKPRVRLFVVDTLVSFNLNLSVASFFE